MGVEMEGLLPDRDHVSNHAEAGLLGGQRDPLEQSVLAGAPKPCPG